MLARNTIDANDKMVLRVIPEDQVGFGFSSYRDSKAIIEASTATARASDRISKSHASELKKGTGRTIEWQVLSFRERDARRSGDSIELGTSFLCDSDSSTSEDSNLSVFSVYILEHVNCQARSIESYS